MVWNNLMKCIRLVYTREIMLSDELQGLYLVVDHLQGVVVKHQNLLFVITWNLCKKVTVEERAQDQT